MPKEKKTAAKTKKPVGRPSKYREEYAHQAYRLCLLGYTDKEMGDFFGVCEDTINEWKKVHKEFSVSVAHGKDFADMDVVEALFVGTKDRVVIEQQAFKVRNQEAPGKYTEKIEVVEVKKVIPADFRNQQFWLKNRQKEKWRDKQEIDHTTDGKPIVTIFEMPNNGRS